jgi:hypothetical protein
MKTIDLKEFTDNFMETSYNLTPCEIRMLYLLITEPNVIKLSRQKFADKIGTHRRTIYLGLLKLLKHEYISDVIITHRNVIEYDNTIISNQIGKSDKNITLTDEEKAKKYILFVMKQLYKYDNKNVLIDENIYHMLIGSAELPVDYKFNRKFITKTIKENYAGCRFHWQKDKTPLSSEERIKIIEHINEEIRIASKFNNHQIDKKRLLLDIKNCLSINKEKGLQVIQEDFPNLTIVGNQIKIPKSLKIKR